MVRFLSLAVVALLVGGVFLLPKADPLRIGADKLQEIVAKGKLPDPAFVDDPAGSEEQATAEEVSLFDVWMKTDAYEEWTEEVDGEQVQRARFSLYGVQVLAQGYELEEEHIELSGRARDAILRGLRIAGQAHTPPVEIIDNIDVGTGGLSALVTLAPDHIHIGWNMPNEPGVGHQFPWTPPDRRSLLPPLVAIALALALRKPALSLFVGVLTGAYLLRRGDGDGVLSSLLHGTLDVGTTFFADQFGDMERAKIVGFVICMLAMVGILVRNGGLRGVMNAISRFAGTARSTQVVTFGMGLAVFFDDYANTILVGGTMRPLADRFRVSREKLAYIVDSTAAPVAGLSLFSTWIAFEVSTFSAQLPLAGLSVDDGYAVFLETLPYRFYCIFALILVGTVVFSKRDFGPMLKAERRAATTGQLVREGGTPMVGKLATAMQPAPGVNLRAYRAVIPLLAFVGVTLFEILRAGGAFQPGFDLFTLEGITQVLYDGSGSGPLLYGSAAGLILAVLLSLQAGLRSDIWKAAWNTLRSMGIAIVILYLAWMINAVCTAIGTNYYLANTLGNIQLPLLLPVALFLLSGAVSFATGSSWGTMSILLPLVVGLSYHLGMQVEIGDGQHFGHGLMILSIGAVLEGSIFGDHCSPISDTTVLSSTAVASDHIDHVRTQAPYALLTMLIAIVAGYFPCAAFPNWNPLYSIVLGGVLIVFTMRVLGKRVPEATEFGDPEGQAETDAPTISRTA